MLNVIIDHQLDIMLGLGCVCATLVVFVMLTRALPAGRRMSVFFMELSAMLLIFADRLCYVYDGDTSSRAYIIVRLANMMMWMMTHLATAN